MDGHAAANHAHKPPRGIQIKRLAICYGVLDGHCAIYGGYHAINASIIDCFVAVQQTAHDCNDRDTGFFTPLCHAGGHFA